MQEGSRPVLDYRNTFRKSRSKQKKQKTLDPTTCDIVINIHSYIIGEGVEMCNETWDGVKKTAYGAFTNVMQFVLPFVTIIFCYTAIIKKLGQRSAQRPGAPRLVLTQSGLRECP